MGFTDTISYYLDPYRFYYIGFVYAFIFFLMLCLIAYYAYSNDFLKMFNKPKTGDIPNASTNKGDNAIMFFSAEWCPHCTKAKTPWDTMKSKYHNEYVNGYKIKFVKHDMTDTDDTNVKDLMNQYNIEGFPTIKMKHGQDIIDFDAKITETSLEQFIQNVTRDE